MSRFVLVTLFCVAISVPDKITILGLSQEKTQTKPEHSESCPKSCKVCDGVIEKALKYIISQQKENGTWNDTVFFTAISGLGLYANGSTTKDGPYKKELQKANEVVVKAVLEGEKKSFYWVGMYIFEMSFFALFLSHVYQTEKTEELKKVLEKIRDYLIKKQGDDGGWGYGGRDCLEEKGAMPFVTNQVIISLLLLNHVGIEVDERVFKEAIKFYSDAQYPNGAYDYSFTGKVAKLPTGNMEIGMGFYVGRTLAALWPMYLLGGSDTETFKKPKSFSEKHLKSTPTCHHGPVYHLFFVGLACFYTKEKALWEKYNFEFRDRIIKAQKEDGSILIKLSSGDQPIDHTEKLGPIYTTPLYTIILQLHKGNLLFDKMKPMKAAEWEKK